MRIPAKRTGYITHDLHTPTQDGHVAPGEMMIRAYRESDRDAVREIAAVCFEGVSIDHNIEKKFGLIGGKDWRWRKKRQIDDDLDANSGGFFVAETGNSVIGYISTLVDRESKIGSIPNFSVLPGHQKKGVGEALANAAVTYLKEQGMEYARIETLEQNAVGRHFYPKLGFIEVARQIHYIMPTGKKP